MKKIVFFSMILSLGIAFWSCSEDDDITPTFDLSIQLIYPEGVDFDFPREIEIGFDSGSRVTKAVPNSSGVATVSLPQGVYSIATSFSVTDQANQQYTFNGKLSNLQLSSDLAKEITLVMATNTGGLIIKEVYFSGTKTPENKSYFSDQFHEIYNNSNDTLYADGLCIGVLQQSSTKANVWLNNEGNFMDRLPLTYHIWTIKGSGTDYPIYPGKSIVIAQDGIDHQTDENGNPNSPVNLGNANWESYVEISGKDIDAPGVPNMTMMYTTSTRMHDWLHSVFGSAVVIFRFPKDIDWKTYAANANNYMTLPGSTSATEYFMIDKSMVIDAVEIVRVEEDKRNKRLPDDLDAGYTYLEGGSYCGLSVRRKAKMIVDGRVIYQDTNNSSEDFLHDLTPTPGQHPSTVEQ